jgi:hypothetical protein
MIASYNVAVRGNKSIIMKSGGKLLSKCENERPL